jgi:ribosomal protein S18 acetylase RimI-like enzyme
VTGLPEGLLARATTRDDLEAVVALVAACEIADLGRAEIAPEDVRGDWRRPSFDLARDSIAVLAADRLVAEGEVFGGRAYGVVHPDHRGRGIGSWLLRWTETRAKEAGATALKQIVSDSDRTSVELLTAHGYEPTYTAWILRIDLEEPPGGPSLPAGISLKPFLSGRDDRDVHELIEGAFREQPNYEPEGFDDWAAHTLRRSDFEPTLLHLAADGDDLVGAALCLELDGEGWVEHLAVRRSHRRRGIGRALLRHAFAEFHHRGLRTCGLSTNSESGALTLYESAGMRVASSYTAYVGSLGA